MSFAEGTCGRAVLKRLAELGATPAANTPAEFKKFIAEDRAKWQRLAKETNLRAE